MGLEQGVASGRLACDGNVVLGCSEHHSKLEYSIGTSWFLSMLRERFQQIQALDLHPFFVMLGRPSMDRAAAQLGSGQPPIGRFSRPPAPATGKRQGDL